MNLSAIDLNLLVVLHAVLTEKSVGEAAKKLHVTSPAVSNALARLREVIGDPLFVRSGRGLTPTPRALELAPVLARSLSDVENSLRGGAFNPLECTRQLTLALSDSDQIASLAKISKVFAKRLPRARLRIVSIDTLMSTGGLAGDQVDLTISPPFEGDGLHSRPLYEEDGILVARIGHPRIRRKLSAKQFNTERHVDIHLLLGRAGAGNRAIEQAFAAAGLTRDVAVIVPSFVAAASVIASTDLIGGLPRRVAQTLARSFPLQILSGPARPFPFHMLLHWHDRTHTDPAASAFREVIVEAIGTQRMSKPVGKPAS